MTTFTKEMSVGQIVSENPLAATLFKSKNIDFCCGGKASLDSECEKNSLNVEEILIELSKIGQPIDQISIGKDTSASQVIDYILDTFHDGLEQELIGLEQLMEKVTRVHGDTYDYFKKISVIFYEMKSELLAHMMKEEQILFPLIKHLENCLLKGEKPQESHCGTVLNPIRQMEFEHDNAGDSLKAMSKYTNDYEIPEGACHSFRGLFSGLKKLEMDLMMHIHTENNILHPMAAEIERKVVQK